MNVRKHTFSKEKNKEFAQTLKQRVNAYFKEHGLSRNANFSMVTKSVILLSIYFGAYGIIISGVTDDTAVLFGLWSVFGLCTAFIGTAVMHDSLHGSYSKSQSVNYLLSFSAHIVGANPRIWQIQHNMLHHTYTNIEHGDDDIAPRFMLRFTPNQQRRWFHRWQHIYAFLFYSLITLIWVFYKDFASAYRYKDMGFIKPGKDFNRLMTEIIIQKILYLFIFLVIPILTVPISPWLTVLMFVTAHLIAGTLLALIFQSAHLVPDAKFIEQEEPMIEENWTVHQLETTANFARKNPFIGWLFGGLNFQIEHHLFPNICHIHYPKLSAIVESTAKEYDIPYHSYKTFTGAVMGHLRFMRDLGQGKPS